MKKRILSLLIALCLIGSLIPATVFAADVVASGTCGENLTWVLDSEGTLTISGTGDMYDWYLLDYDTPWYEYRDTILAVVIQEGVTSIGESAFANMDNVLSISIPNSITSIGVHAIEFCGSLEEIYIPVGVTDIDTPAFSNCDKLKSISVAVDNPAFCSVDGVLYNKNIESLVTWPGGKGNGIIPESVTTICASALADCDQITEVTIPSNVKNIGEVAFSGCENLAYVKIEKDAVFESRSFKDCNKISRFEAGKESTIYSSENGVLYNKDKTILIKCPPMQKSISIPDSVSTIGEYAFDGCNYLLDIHLPATVDTIEAHAFGFCGNLRSIEIPDGVTSIEDYTFSGCRKLTTIVVPRSVTSIGHWAFYSCDALSHVLYSGSEDQWNAIEKDEDTELPEDVVITYNYTGGNDYHIYDNETDTECNVCDYLRLVGYVGEKLQVEITTNSENGFVLTGERAESVTVEYYGQSSIVIGDKGTYCIGYNLTFSQLGSYDLCFVQEETGYKYEFSAVITEHTHDFENGICTECGAVDPDYTEPTEPTVPEESDPTNPSEPEESEPTVPINPGEHTHSYGDWIIVKDPSSREEGLQERSCECGEVQQCIIPALTNPFDDVKSTDFYYEPVLWASHKGITSGMSATEFGPKRACTRGHIVTFLWRAAGEPEPTTTVNPFSDVSESAFYYKAVLWAVENGITAGMGNGEFWPNATCTRAQAVTFLYRASGEPEVTNWNNPFRDVKDSAFYYDAVLWAVENNITTGMSAGEFGPNLNCTRGQIVTFLYRTFAK